MKFAIKHEIKGRLRVHMAQQRMTYEQADVLQYYLQQSDLVVDAKVYEQTADVVISYNGDRAAIIHLLCTFKYQLVEVPEGYLESTGRELNAEYKEKFDEAGIEYNNRDFKDFSKKSLYFYKYHRHYQLAIDVFSQGFDDMDKKIRTLAQKLYVVKKGLLPWFIHRRQIKKRVGINDMSKEIIDEYYFVPWSTKIIFSPPLWKMFNTISREEYPQKQWKKW